MDTLPLRQSWDPTAISDILLPVEAVSRDLFHPLSGVEWKNVKIQIQDGKLLVVGKMNGGGVKWRGCPGKVVLWLGACPTVIASGNCGAILVWCPVHGWYLREFDYRELRAAQTLASVVRLPSNEVHRLRVIGNAVPSRMAQALARSVVGPYLESCGSHKPGVVPDATPWRQDPAYVGGLERALEVCDRPQASVRDLLSLVRPRISGGLSRFSTEHKPVKIEEKKGTSVAVRQSCGGGPLQGASIFKSELSENEQSVLARLDRMVEKGVLQQGGRSEKFEKELSKKGRIKASTEDKAIKKALLEVDQASVRFRTSVQYEDQWVKYLVFCHDLQLDPFMVAYNDKQRSDVLTHFVLHRYVHHMNKYGTIRGYLSAIRWYFLEEGERDPTKGPRFLRRLRGIKNLRGAVTRKEPVTVEMVQWAWRAGRKGDMAARAAATAIVIMFFFLLRVGEVTGAAGEGADVFSLTADCVQFTKVGVECSWKDSPDGVAIKGKGDKVSNNEWFRNHFATGSELCPVRALAEWFSMVEGKIQPNEPLFKHFVEKGRMQLLTRNCVGRLIKQSAVACGHHSADYGTHSCRAGGATALLQAGCSRDLLRIIGRWESDACNIYTRHTQSLMQGVAKDMASVDVNSWGKISASAVKVR